MPFFGNHFCGSALPGFLRCRIPDLDHVDQTGHDLPCQGRVAVYREFSVLDTGDMKHLGLSCFILKHHLGAQAAELRWNIFDIVRNDQPLIPQPVSVLRRQPDFDPLPRSAPLKCGLDPGSKPLPAPCT